MSCLGWSFTHQGGGTGLVLYVSDSTGVSLSFKLEFLCSSSEAQYRTLI